MKILLCLKNLLKFLKEQMKSKIQYWSMIAFFLCFIENISVKWSKCFLRNCNAFLLQYLTNPIFKDAHKSLVRKVEILFYVTKLNNLFISK